MKFLALHLTLIVLIFSCSSEKKPEKIDYQTSLEKANDELLNKGNIDFADDLFAPDYNNIGPDGIKEMVTNLRAAFPDLKVSVESKVADGKMHAWRRTHTGTHQAPIMGFMPLNNEITWHSIIISERNEEDRISREWGSGDLFNQLAKSSANGVYKYISPLDGYAIINSDKFMWTFNNTENSQFFSEYGTIEFNNGLLIYNVQHSNQPERIGLSFRTRIIGQYGDTIKWHFVNKSGEITGMGQSLKIPQ